MKAREGTTHVPLDWLDAIKAVALLWIFTNHVAERLFGFPWIANPSADWPPLHDRVAQLAPLPLQGLGSLANNLLRWVGWAGDQGVQLFLIASGFALTWGMLGRDAPRVDLRSFYGRRAARIYPLWWAAHLLLLLCGFLTGWGIDPFDPHSWWSALGIRVTPGLLYFGSPAWWYIGLQIQLYAIFPLLWRGLAALGPGRFLALTLALSLAIRAAGLLTFESYLDAWSRGAIFVSRLPEFGLGMALAAWLHRRPAHVDRSLRGGVALALAGAAYVTGTVLALFLLGNAFSPLLLGAGVFGVLYAILRAWEGAIGSLPAWLVGLGRRSYPLYLVHHPLILLLVAPGASPARRLLGIAMALGATVFVGLALERATDRASQWLCEGVGRRGLVRTGMRLAPVALVILALGLGGDTLIRRFDPQEVLGWGERPSLEPDPRFGWRLKPDTTTRLRWLSYDYVVSANSLGFPGPLPPEARTEGTLRILVTGDAFTSAEGVDTADAWPRLLERELKREGTPAEVLNFAITGYGPNQYAAVIAAYAPRFRPDLILVGLFANDFDDVRVTQDEFQRSIGFGRPSPDAPSQRLRPYHLRRWLELHAFEPLGELLTGRPGSHAYFLTYAAALRRDREDYVVTGRRLAEARFEEINAVAHSTGASVWLLMIPTPVQVCPPEALRNRPLHLDLSDRKGYDLDQPQRLAREMAHTLGIGYHDLTPALQAAAACPYQPENLHWTEPGHVVVAREVARMLREADLDHRPSDFRGKNKLP